MEFFDVELLETKREIERQKYNSLETGMFAGDELITFTQIKLPGSEIHIPLPNQFIPMPDKVKKMKYPSKDAPEFVITSLDSTVNIAFNLLPIVLQKDEIKVLSMQFQNAIKNVNPSIKIKNQTNSKTELGSEMTWFDYKGYHLDGQSFSRVYLIKMRKCVLHSVFNCEFKDKETWTNIINKLFIATIDELQ